jgi:hypothetical protein
MQSNIQIAPSATGFVIPPTIEQLRAQIRFLRIIQRPVGVLFWFLEQRISHLDVEIQRGRGDD